MYTQLTMLKSVRPAIRNLVEICRTGHLSPGSVKQKSVNSLVAQSSSVAQFSTDYSNAAGNFDKTVNVGKLTTNHEVFPSALEDGTGMQNKAERLEASIKKKKWKKMTKFHSRVLNKEEILRDKQLIQDVSALPESEIFGTLTTRKTKSARTRPKDSAREITDHAPAKPNATKQKFQALSIMSEDEGASESFEKYGGYNIQHKQSQLNSPGPVTNYWPRTLPQRADGGWTETFGTLDGGVTAEKLDQEEISQEGGDEEGSVYRCDGDEDERPRRRLQEFGKQSPNWYGRRMLKFAEEGKIKEAIDVLEVWMLKNDRIRPNYYVFSTLISVLGRAGYTKKAFQVFNQMKKMGVAPKENTYTALFNACSNSPWPEDGLNRASNLRSLMQDQSKAPNLITYRAMIKAFGVCGDLQTAFALLDEASERFKPDVKCFSFLLMACCSDKESGFRHAIQVWRLMRRRRLTPDLYLYNLLLRVIRDCGIGDKKLAVHLIYGDSTTANSHRQQLLSKASTDHNSNADNILPDIRRLAKRSWHPLTGESFCENSTDNAQLQIRDNIEDLMPDSKIDSELVPTFQSSQESLPAVLPTFNIANLPNILNRPLHESQQELVSVNLDSLSSSEARLFLAGGASGFLKNMDSDGVKPDIKTLSQLVNCIPSNLEAENFLLQTLDEKNIKPDVDFLNMIIRKRNLRKDYQGAKEILISIGHYQLMPNLMTFGCLSMGCQKKADGIQLLKDMQSAGLMPNAEIFTILVLNSGGDFSYKLHLLRQMEQLDVTPNTKLLNYLEYGVQYAKQKIVDQERGKKANEFFTSDYFHNGYKEFMRYYRPWLGRTPLAKMEHPWARFRHPKPEPELVAEESAADQSLGPENRTML